MRRILVVNTKGGCGKTTIATNLASYYAIRGMNTVLFDYDSQRSSTHWLRLRDDRHPAIHGVTAFEPHRPGLTRAWQLRVPPDTDRVIIDTPASMDRNELVERARNADAVLIPVLPSPIDTYAAADFIRDLFLVGKVRSERTRIGILPNRVRHNTRSFQALQRFLGSLNIPVVGLLRDTQVYVQAIDQGVGIHELAESRAWRERRTWRTVVKWLEAETAAAARPA